MPRQKSLVTIIRELVQAEVGSALGSLLGTGSPKSKDGRRRKTRGKWRPGGPGRPPKSVDEVPKRTSPRANVKKARRKRRRPHSAATAKPTTS
jgi:hypothetical protein